VPHDDRCPGMVEELHKDRTPTREQSRMHGEGYGLDIPCALVPAIGATGLGRGVSRKGQSHRMT
jgi:hypothetical protein